MNLLNRHTGPEEFDRRKFVAVIGLGLVAPLVHLAGTDVEIVEFTDAGERKGVMKVAKIVRTDDAWKRQLSPLAYHVARERGTERAFSGEYWNLHEAGLFRCRCCDTALFSSSAKFDSGTGWPSFWQPIAEQNVVHGKPSGGVTDSEVTCRRCDAHLGDLFDDGPKPTGLRYCIDSVSLRFVKKA
jgi:peptide-methionine (R)-S-oxide reductase